MIGRIRRRSKNSWEITIDLGRDAEGKRIRKFVNVKGKKKDAERKRRELLTARDGGMPIPMDKVTVAVYLEQWLSARERDVRARTIYEYRRYVHYYALPAFGHLQLTQLQPAHLDALYTKMQGVGLSGRTCLHMHRILHHALKQAVRQGLIVRNLAQAAAAPKADHHEMKHLTAWQLHSLLSATANDLYHPIYYLAAWTGMRRGEIVGPKWQDIDLEQGTISMRRTLLRVPGKGYVEGAPKTAKSKRLISITGEVVTMLKRHRAAQAEGRLAAGPAWQDNDLVFTVVDGGPVDPDEITHAFSRAVRRLGLPQVRFHDLRHTHASLLLAQNVHPKVVQERLGHSTIAITLDTYSHSIPGLQGAAAKAFEGIMAAAQAAPVS